MFHNMNEAAHDDQVIEWPDSADNDRWFVRNQNKRERCGSRRVIS